MILGFSHKPDRPLVAASGRISRFAGLAILEAARIDIVSSAKERAKQSDLGLGWREEMDNPGDWIIGITCLLAAATILHGSRDVSGEARPAHALAVRCCDSVECGGLPSLSSAPKAEASFRTPERRTPVAGRSEKPSG